MNWTRLALATVFASTALAQSFTTQVNVQWSSAQKLLLTDDSRFHPGEVLTVSLNGSVCSPHINNTEKHGFWPFEETVHLSYHTQLSYGDLPVQLALVSEGTGSEVTTLQLTSATGTIVAPGDSATLTDRVQLAGFVPNIEAGRRAASHGEYSLNVSLEAQPRLDLLKAWLAGARRTVEEITAPDLVCSHLKSQAPQQSATEILHHVATYYSDDTPANRPASQKILTFARTLDPNNPDIAASLGSSYLASGHYGRAREQLADAIEKAKARILSDPSDQNAWKTLGFAERKLAEVYYKDKVGIDASDLAEADLLLTEAIAAFDKAGDTPNVRLALLDKTRVLERIRTIESLRAASEALDRARKLSPRSLN